MDIESAMTVQRWDFSNSKQIFEKPVNMVAVLRDLKLNGKNVTDSKVIESWRKVTIQESSSLE